MPRPGELGPQLEGVPTAVLGPDPGGGAQFFLHPQERANWGPGPQEFLQQGLRGTRRQDSNGEGPRSPTAGLEDEQLQGSLGNSLIFRVLAPCNKAPGFAEQRLCRRTLTRRGHQGAFRNAGSLRDLELCDGHMGGK